MIDMTATNERPRGLRGEWINHTDHLARPRLSDEEHRAFGEVLRHYGPYSVFRAFTTYFRAGSGMPMYVGHGQYFDFDHVLGRLLGLSGLSTGFGGQIYGGGKGHDLFGMTASSLGEAVERVLGAIACVELRRELLTGSYRDLAGRGLTCLHPDEAPIFAPEQYAAEADKFEQWAEDTRLGWVPGRRLLSGEQVYVPAQLVMLFYARDEEEPRIGLAPSGGLASHINAWESLFHAILELFERDAVNLRWHARIPLDRIVLDRPIRSKPLRRLLETAEGAPSPIRFFHHNLDLEEYPVVTVKQFDPAFRRYGYYAGGGVADDVEEAMLSALTEFSQAERSLKICLAAPDWEFSSAFSRQFHIDEDATPEQFTNYIQVIPYYGYEESRHRLDWYLDDGGEVPLSTLPTVADRSPTRRWEQLRALLRARGWDPIVFDLTPPQFEQTRLVKVVMPQLSPPYPPSAPGLGHPRYAEVPLAAGRTDHPLTYAELNHAPLPYP